MSIKMQNTQTPKQPSEIVQLARRLSEVDLDGNRVVPLRDGTKKSSINHSLPDNRYNFVEFYPKQQTANDELGNYGIHAGDGLLLIDIDDYDGTGRPAILSGLPETFTTESPHRGEHRYYSVPANTPEKIKEVVGANNPREDWGEVRSLNTYVVGPGSQLDGCDKDWCNRCSDDDGGYYTVAEDRPIAELEIETLLNFLKEVTEANEATSASKADEDVDRTQSSEDKTEQDFPDDYDPIPEQYSVNEWISERALEADETLKNLWQGDYASEGYDDRSSAEYALAFKLAFWLGPDKERVASQMDRASTKKWQHRVDGYRESVLEAVDKQREFYSGSVLDIAPIPDTLDFEETLEDNLDGDITREEAQERTQETLKEAFQGDDAVLVEALPTLGKSYGAVKTAAKTELPITMLTQRRDLYEDVQEWCVELGLSSHELPAMTEHCPTYTASPSNSAERKLVDLYERGATPREIHETLNPPCQQNGECQSLNQWDFDADEYDVLVGYYTQAKVDPIIEDRVVVIDECPDEVFDTTVDENVGSSVSEFLQYCQKETDLSDQLPTNYAKLYGLDPESDVGSDLRSAIEDFIDQRDAWNPGVETSCLELNQYTKTHRRAPEVAYAVLCGDSEYNDYDRVMMDNGTVLLHDPQEVTVHVRDPPSFENAQSVVCLDGTPIESLWEQTLGVSLTGDSHKKVLDTAERKAYVSDVQGWEFVQTNVKCVYNYTLRNHVNFEKSAALIEAVRRKHDREPTVISTKECIELLDDKGVIDQDSRATYYGNLKSSNDFADQELGIVIGTRHFPRERIRRETAFAGEEIEIEGDGIEKTYNSNYGDDFLTHMRDHEVLQAAMRFGRDEDTQARVYIHTACLPDWVPRKIHEVDIRTFSSTAKGDVLDVLTDTEPPWTAADLHEDDRIDVTKRQVENILQIFCEEEILRRDESIRPYEYHEDDIENANDYGFVFGL